jgi:N-ethylmaleimide reductase
VAEALIKNGDAKAVSFGMNFISNPNLVHKLKENLPLTAVNMSTIYAKGEIGYTDYI